MHPNWYKILKERLLDVELGIKEQEFFFKYAIEYIEPALQVILRRDNDVIFAVALTSLETGLKKENRSRITIETSAAMVD